MKLAKIVSIEVLIFERLEDLVNMRFQRNKDKWWLGVGLAALTVYVVLAFGIGLNTNWIHQIDTPIQEAAKALQTTSRTQFFQHLAFWGAPTMNLVFSALIAGCFWIKKKRFLASVTVVLQFGVNVLTYVLKLVSQRPRPAHKLLAQSGFSFPSGHTTSTAILILVICLLVIPQIKRAVIRWLLALIAIAWLFLIMADRIYLFVHYPTDVLGGLAMTLVWWVIVRGLLSHYQTDEVTTGV